MFDTQECVEVEDGDVEIDGDGGGNSNGRNKHDLRGNKNALNRRQNEAAGTEEDIELQEMGGHGDDREELDGAARVGETSRRPSRADEAVSSLDVGEKRGRGRRTSEQEQEQEEASARDAAISFISNSVSERMATFGTHQNYMYRAAQHLESYILCNQFGEFPRLVGRYCS